VSNAWAGFGAAFGPVVILSLYWQQMTKNGALAGILTGAITVLIWIYAPITIDGKSLSSFMYEIVPGFILSTLAIYIVSINSRRGVSESIGNKFIEMKQLHQ
jgi:SSS family solute:Na+ symporter/sodium/proline symporter